ncbi:hypothetical protein [Flagellimonas marina]|uniref:WD40-like Beta Propeller Repeat n=1 Tax=Flagellimonas marina TaxID=1775168 RepID=A0ABV8PF95_9FLAO
MKWIVALVCFFLGFSGWTQAFQPFPENHNRLVQGIDFSSDGKVLYMALPHKERVQQLGVLDVEDAPRLALYQSIKTKNGWEEPVLLKISGKYKDYEPAISPKGDILFFNSNRPLNGNQSHEKNNIWYSKFENGSWGQPQSLHKINTPDEEQSYTAMAENGKLIYTAEVIQNGRPHFALFETVFEGRATKVGKVIEFPGFNKNASDPWISPNGDYLIFTGFDLEDWQNTCNLYISFNQYGKWTMPKEIEELNSKGPDFSPAVSRNGKWIFYRKNYEFQQRHFKKILKGYSRKRTEDNVQ